MSLSVSVLSVHNWQLKWLIHTHNHTATTHKALNVCFVFLGDRLSVRIWTNPQHYSDLCQHIIGGLSYLFTEFRNSHEITWLWDILWYIAKFCTDEFFTTPVLCSEGCSLAWQHIQTLFLLQIWSLCVTEARRLSFFACTIDLDKHFQTDVS